MKKLLLLLLLYPLFLFAQNSPLSTSGGNIVDANGKTLLIKGVNWWGANGSRYPYSSEHKGTDTHAMPFGLHVQKIEVIAKAIKEAGFNSVRLPFSNEMLHDTSKIRAEWLGPNTELQNKSPLEVFDAVVKALSAEGLYVLLNNHSTTTHWCCNYDFNGLWFGGNKHFRQNAKAWIADWKMLAERYKNNPWVVAADLRNEVRPQRSRFIPLPKNPNWGRKNRRDWHKYATLAGNAIHEVNPNLLIIVEGINAQTRYLVKLKFPHLLPLKKRPIQLKQAHKLVYEVHNYSFSWSKANLARRKKQRRYSDLSTEERMAHYEKYWGFVVNPTFEHQAPVILGEFGCSAEGQDAKLWLKDLTTYIEQKKIGFCWWTLEEDLLSKGSYGIMNSTMDKTDVQSDWRWEFLEKLLQQNNP
jgi:aryl-phospho-beta-D-glucosidase BglC (GH1 family)